MPFVGLLSGKVCLSIRTSLKQQHWVSQWCEFGAGPSVCPTNDRRGVFGKAV